MERSGTEGGAGAGQEGGELQLHPHLEERFSSLPALSEDDQELRRFGCWAEQFHAMNLPSFRAVYLFLCRVPKDIILECLKASVNQTGLRLPSFNSANLSISASRFDTTYRDTPPHTTS